MTSTASDSFGHGYVVTQDGTAPEATRSWATLPLGQLTYRFQHRTAYAHHRPELEPARPAIDVVIIGHPVDLDAGTSDIQRIARQTAATAAAGGTDAAVRYVAYLGGRFTCYLHEGDQLTVVPDCHATQAVFWSAAPGRFTASSHAWLAASAAAAEVDDHALGLHDKLIKVRQGAGTKYLPGVVTAYRDIRPLIPNCVVRADLGAGQADHQRFYPFEELPALDVDDAYDRFENLFRAHAGLLASFGQVGVSVTAGLDSRVTLAGSHGLLPPGSFTFTFFRHVDAADAHADDLYEGNRIAWEYGLPHRVVRWDGRRRSPDFDALFRASFPRLPQARTLAQAFYEQLPRDFYHFQSTIAETGTVFYQRRNDPTISAKRLTHLWHGAGVAEVNELVAAFDDFIDFADFRADRLHNLDYHDAFYWEHRNSRWAANRYHEADLAHRVLLPFNQRRLIETMLSIPIQQRTDKVLLHRLADRFPPGRSAAGPAGVTAGKQP